MRTYGKPQIKATSTSPSANSPKDFPTLSVVGYPILSPTYLVICAYTSYVIGERNVTKRITGAVFRLSSILFTFNFSNHPETPYASPPHALPTQGAAPSPLSTRSL